jgi:pimeloyl-ACP methyl ester carboxylesterase
MPAASRHFLALGAHGFHRIGFHEWGDPGNPRVLVCVHGLTRTGMDFETLAEAVCDRWRVVAPDMPGRGLSEPVPAEAYSFPLYVAQVAALFAHLGVDELDYVGTSMGGVIGMMLAAAKGSPIRRMMLNDIGGVIASEGLARIATYAGNNPLWATKEEAIAALVPTSMAFGPMTAEQRRRFVEIQLREREDGWRFHYDPAIAGDMKKSAPVDIPLWTYWDAIRCPTLVLRGADSDLLRADTLAEMQQRGPGCETLVVRGVGHTPALVDEEQISAVRAFLAKE